MIFNKQQRKDFEEATRPLMAFLGKNCHPHVTGVVDNASAELMEGVVMFKTEDYIKD